MPVSTSPPHRHLRGKTLRLTSFNLSQALITTPLLLKISNKTQQVHSAKGKKTGENREAESLLSAEFSQSRPEAAC